MPSKRYTPEFRAENARLKSGLKRVEEERDILIKADVFDYIEVFYNRNRRHSHLGQVSPHDFEQAALTPA